jgi:hypothetical protein
MNVSDIFLCKQTIVWERMVSRDEYGKPTYGTPTTYRGRRAFHAQRTDARSGDGVDVISSSQIWIMAPLEIGYEDKVYVQGDDPDKAPPIVSVERAPDSTGKERFVKVLLGRAE